MAYSQLTHEAAAWVRERHASPVATVYFSDTNIDALHDALRYGVYKRTQKIIGRQSTHDLLVTMRSNYLSHAMNRPDHVLEQVRELNARVIRFCVDRIVVEIQAREKYLADSSQDGYADAISLRSVNTSSKGDRSLEFARPGVSPP